jgi:cytoskeletal protein RodZ
MPDAFNNSPECITRLVSSARTRLQIELTEVSSKLKIPESVLLDIERGTLSSGITPRIMHNFVRDYANYLDLDTAQARELYWRSVQRTSATPIVLDELRQMRSANEPRCAIEGPIRGVLRLLWLHRD